MSPENFALADGKLPINIDEFFEQVQYQGEQKDWNEMLAETGDVEDLEDE